VARYRESLNVLSGTSSQGRITVNYLDEFLERNQRFATEQSSTGRPMPSLPDAMPKVKAAIIGCADMRVDPAHILGLQPGEAIVLRNVGGRITPGLLEQLGMLGRIGQVAQRAPADGGEFHLIVLQHTDCGITRLVGETAMLSHYFQLPETDLEKKTVNDPRQAVAGDVALLHSIPVLPASWLISGLVYDVTTGVVETVVPPAPVRNE
jgi:carbonic anhydrase